MENLKMIEVLIAQGIPAKTAERMVASLEDKPKKVSSAKRAYAIANNPKRKRPTSIEVLTICDCCGHTETKTMIIDAYPDSPTTQKVPQSLCEHCPDYFRALTHEQLVSLALVRRHAGIQQCYSKDSSHIKFAKKYTPEEIIILEVKA